MSNPSRSFHVLHLVGQERDSGGILTTLRSLQRASLRAGDRHTVLVAPSYIERRTPNLTYRRSRHFLSHGLSWRVLWGAMMAFLELRAPLRRNEYDVVHAHTRGGFALALMIHRLLGRSVIFTNHTYASRTWMYRRAARLPGFHTVVLTPNMARYYGLQVEPPQVSVISECCPDALFSREFSRPRKTDPPTAENPYKLVGLGGIVRWKQWHLILEALASLPKELAQRFRFHHWGAPSPDRDSMAYAEELRQMRTRPDLAKFVMFHDPIPDATEELASADWFVLPSVNEPCSLALLEALALGVPALVSLSGGNADIVEAGRNGWHFLTGDSANLAGHLRRLAVEPQLSLTAEAIRESVRPRMAANVAPAYRSLYDLAVRR